MMNDCICKWNFRQIIKESESLFDKTFVDDKGIEWCFYGVVWGRDDLYYGMNRKDIAQTCLLSCVGSIEGHGYILKEE